MDLYYIVPTGIIGIDFTGGNPLTEPVVMMRHRLETVNFFIVGRTTGAKVNFQQLKPLSAKTLNFKFFIREKNNFDGTPLVSISQTVEGSHVKWSKERECYVFNFCPSSAALNIALGRTLGTNDGTAISPVTGDSTTDILTYASHGYGEGDSVKFTTLIGGDGLTAGTHYFIRNPATDTFQLSETVDGAVINFTANVTSATMILVEGGGEDKASLECMAQIAWSLSSGDSGTWEGPPAFAITMLNDVADLLA